MAIKGKIKGIVKIKRPGGDLSFLLVALVAIVAIVGMVGLVMVNNATVTGQVLDNSCAIKCIDSSNHPGVVCGGLLICTPNQGGQIVCTCDGQFVRDPGFLSCIVQSCFP